MLKKDLKINKSSEYNCIYKTGRRIQGKHIIIFIRDNDEAFNRFGIVASKKVGNAVKRNRAKRQIRAVISKNSNILNNGFDIIIIARASIKGMSFALIERDFLYIMKRARLY